MGSLLDRLDTAERAISDRVKEIQEQIMALAAESDQAEQELAQFRIARQVIAKVEAESGPPADPEPDKAVEQVEQFTPDEVARAPFEFVLEQSLQPVSPAPAASSHRPPLPRWNPKVDSGELWAQVPAGYQQIVKALMAANATLKAVEVCGALDLGTDRILVEGIRARLSKLVARGWCVSPGRGDYQLAPGVRKWLE